MLAHQCLELRELHGITVVYLLDSHLVEGSGIDHLAEELYQLIEADGRRKLVVNFSSVEFISSAGLGKLVVLQKKVNAHGGTLRFCCIRPEVREIFAVTKFDGLFDIRNDEADALSDFN